MGAPSHACIALTDTGEGMSDETRARAGAQSLLEDMGYEVLAAACADEALALLEGGRVDILFSDVVMPGLSGIELARAAREKRPDLPVILASFYSDEILAGAGACFEFVRKPYDAAMLDRAIQAALEQVEAVGA